MERPEYISYILIVLLLFLSPAKSCPETSYRQQIYQAYLKGDMDRWDQIIQEMEKEEWSSVNEKLELLSYYYGYIGYLIGVKEKKKAKEMIEKGDQLTKTILEIEPRNVTAYAYEGSFIAYKMAINKLTTMILGPECIRHIHKAYESDTTNIQAIADKANLLFYSPGMFGGNKNEAIRYYEKAISLLEQNQETENNWQYLNLLTTLGQQYESLGNQEAARKTYEKILQIEPDYTWVKEELYPQMKK